MNSGLDGVTSIQLSNQILGDLEKIAWLLFPREELKINEIPEDVINKLLDLLQIEGENKVVLAALRDQLGDYPVALEGIAELEEIIGYLEVLDIPEVNCKVKFAMVRGLEYYTGPIYETVVEEPKIGSITGGGDSITWWGCLWTAVIPPPGQPSVLSESLTLWRNWTCFPRMWAKPLLKC